MVNSSFSTVLPTLQLAWDSTSLGALKTCPRFYQYSIVEGWQPRHISVHLTFGLHYHAALERYDHAKASGLSHEESEIKAIRYLLEVTWDKEKQRPWCSDDPNKNRFTLVRSVVWFLEQFKEESLKTVILANGKPAVELSFRFDSGVLTNSTGETFLLCGHLDRLVEFQDKFFVADRKTSKSTLTQDFFDKFSPDNQFSLYTLAGHVVYSLPIEGLIVDGAQIAVTFSRFARGFSPRTKEQTEEWFKDFQFWVAQAEVYAKAEYWPMNDKACGNYGGCQYRGICSKSPKVRERWLQADFTKRVWDPLITRGDV